MITKKTAELLASEKAQRIIEVVKGVVNTMYADKHEDVTRKTVLSLMQSGVQLTSGNIRIFAENAGYQVEAQRRKEKNKALTPENIFKKTQKIVNKSFYHLSDMDKEDLISETIIVALETSKTEIITEGFLYLNMITAAQNLGFADKKTIKKYIAKYKVGTITGKELEALETYQYKKNTLEIDDFISETVADTRPTADVMLDNGWLAEMNEMLDNKFNSTKKERYSITKNIINLVVEGNSITEAAEQLAVKPKTAWQYLRNAGDDYNYLYKAA